MRDIFKKEELKRVAEALAQAKEEFMRLNELLKELDPEKAIKTIIKLSELCQCDSWDEAMVYRFLVLDPQEKKQIEVLSQIYYMKLSNRFLSRLPQIDEIFKQVAKVWHQSKGTDLKP